MSHEAPDPQLAALEAALKTLTPLPGRIERDRLMFQAGQASVARRPWLWPGTTAVMTLLAAVFAGLLLHRPAPHADSPPAPVTVSASPEDAGAPEFVRLRQQALRDGAETMSVHLTEAEETPQRASHPAIPPPDLDTPSLLGRGTFTKS
jgi:hypothetical protein